MTPPDLDRMWETFVRIGPPEELPAGRHLHILRTLVAPLITDLQARELMGWYSFLIHDHASGVPASAEDRDAFWHIRLSLRPETIDEALFRTLPGHCEMTRHIKSEDLQQIAGLRSSKLRGDSTEAWRIIGEASEWLLRMLAACKTELPWAEMWPEIAQYVHYYANMTRLQMR